VIKDRLTYGRKPPLQTSKRERKHGRDITSTLRAMPAPDWAVENWPGCATVIAVRGKGICDGKPTDETRYYVGSPEKSDQLGSLIEAKYQAIESNSVRLCSDQWFACNKQPNVHKHHP
jgi:hypothetical protein